MEENRTNGGNYVLDILPLFYLPQVQSLNISLHNPLTFSWPIETAPDPSTISSLTLRLIREQHLYYLLSETSGLRNLKWLLSYYEELGRESCTPVIDLDKLGDALFQVRNTLKELVIDTVIHKGLDDPPTLYMTGSLGALIYFSQLDKLVIPIQFLAGAFDVNYAMPLKEVVPICIRFLTITDGGDLLEQEESSWDWKYETHLTYMITQWLQDWEISKRDLKTVKLVMDRFFDKKIIEKLVPLCDRYGFQVIAAEYDKYLF